MGVPLDGPDWMVGDNEYIITSSTIPHSVLGKRHTFLSYHRVRCAVSHDVMNYCFCPSKQNISDVLTKSLGFKKLWLLVKPLLFWISKKDTKI